MSFDDAPPGRGLSSVAAFLAVFLTTIAIVGILSLSTTPAPVPGPKLERSGPVSTWPASWTDICGTPVSGNATTVDELNQAPSQSFPGITSLDQLYGIVVNSTSFENITAGLGWVTISWSYSEVSGFGVQYAVANADFVLLSGSHPAEAISNGTGLIQAEYSSYTGAVSVTFGIPYSCGIG